MRKIKGMFLAASIAAAMVAIAGVQAVFAVSDIASYPSMAEFNQSGHYMSPSQASNIIGQTKTTQVKMPVVKQTGYYMTPSQASQMIKQSKVIEAAMTELSQAGQYMSPAQANMVMASSSTFISRDRNPEYIN